MCRCVALMISAVYTTVHCLSVLDDTKKYCNYIPYPSEEQ